MKTIICPFCEENESELDPVLGPLLCRKCADWRGEQADMAERINSMGGNARWGD